MTAVASPVVPVPPVGHGPGCERLSEGLLAEPVSAVTSLAFVVAALVIARPPADPGGPASGPADGDGPVPSRLVLAVLVAGIGVGSAIQHGPDPAWSDLAHDLPLLATLAFVAADAVADLTDRRRRWWWWSVPTVGLVPLILGAPRVGDLAQVAVAVVAVALTLLRARDRPRSTRAIVWSVGLLAVGATIGALSRSGGPLCDPDTIWQGHAAWHVLASAALVVLAPVVGRRGRVTAGR